jgi:hypothetical protein
VAESHIQIIEISYQKGTAIENQQRNFYGLNDIFSLICHFGTSEE